MSRVILLVGAGHMGRSALGMLARQIPDARFKIVDRSPESLKLAVAADPVRIEGELRDISRAGLDAAGVDLVLNFAGPFFVGSDAAARAAIAAGAAALTRPSTPSRNTKSGLTTRSKASAK